MAVKKGFTELHHAMVNSGTITQEFCSTLGLRNIFGSLVQCSSLVDVGTALTLEDGATALTLENGATALVFEDS